MTTRIDQALRASINTTLQQAVNSNRFIGLSFVSVSRNGQYHKPLNLAGRELKIPTRRYSLLGRPWPSRLREDYADGHFDFGFHGLHDQVDDFSRGDAGG
jgi:hypothetical protein